MCSCFEVSDFVCFFTFFITAIVSLLFVQYFFVYLDSELDDKSRMFNSSRCLYFFLLTFLGCLVFAGIQRRSIFLLKWPSRFLVTLLIIGLVSLTIYLWVLDKNHQSVRDLEGKTAKFTFVIILLFLYSWGIQRFISQLNRPVGITVSTSTSPVSTTTVTAEGLVMMTRGSSFNANARYIFDQSDHETHPMMTLITESFRKKTAGKQDKASSTTPSTRDFNVASNGVNYYQLLLEGSVHPTNPTNKMSSSRSRDTSGKKSYYSSCSTGSSCSKDCTVSFTDYRLTESESAASITEV